MLEREMKNTLQHYHGLTPKGVEPLYADQFNKNSKTQGKTKLGHQGDMYKGAVSLSQGQAGGYGHITSFVCRPHGANTSNLNNSLMAQYFCNFISE